MTGLLITTSRVGYVFVVVQTNGNYTRFNATVNNGIIVPSTYPVQTNSISSIENYLNFFFFFADYFPLFVRSHPDKYIKFILYGPCGKIGHYIQRSKYSGKVNYKYLFSIQNSHCNIIPDHCVQCKNWCGQCKLNI